MAEQTVSLLDQIKEVAEIRRNASELLEAKKQSYAKWEQDNNELLAQISLATEVQDKAETLLRELTIKAYNETGSKQPAPGLGIREYTRLEYDPKEALKWAMQHQIALSLDKKSFEGFAKATPLEFVQVHQEVQATIATDLNKVLEEIK